MRRLGKRNNGLSIIMEGNVGKVMKGGKLLERVRFERGVITLLKLLRS